MERRQFIRLVGCGTVGAALGTSTGCSSSAYPPAAVAAWQGPPADADLRRWALGYAILAPNSHNRQPWLVDLREPNAISLFVDRERLLPETDPWFRQIVISQGTFIEALVLALRECGVEPSVQLFPQGEFAPRALDARPVARLSWQAAQVELLTPTTVMESVRLTRMGPKEIEQHRDGISINGVMPRLAAAFGAFDRSQPPAPGSSAYQQKMGRFQSHSETAMGFIWQSTAYADDAAAGRTRSAEVQAGRAYMRLQLEATRLGLQVHPMSQASQEFSQMNAHYERLHELTVGKPAQQEVVQMFCRIGYCDEQPHTPRRGVDAIIQG